MTWRRFLNFYPPITSMLNVVSNSICICSLWEELILWRCWCLSMLPLPSSQQFQFSKSDSSENDHLTRSEHFWVMSCYVHSHSNSPILTSKHVIQINYVVMFLHTRVRILLKFSETFWSRTAKERISTNSFQQHLFTYTENFSQWQTKDCNWM